MSILSFASFFGHSDDHMARKKPLPTKVPNDSSIASYGNRFVRAGTDREAFERVLAELNADGTLVAGDVIAIAQLYIGGGKRATSKKAALSAISKRFVEVVRFHKKNAAATNVRPW